MNVFLNNQQHFLERKKKLSVFFTELKIDSSKGIAIAVNDSVIPKSEWENFILNDNDKITLIRATAGG